MHDGSKAQVTLLILALLMIFPASLAYLRTSQASFGKRITGIPYKEMSSTDIFECHDQCEDDTKCQAINFFKNTSLCQLFNYTTKYKPRNTLDNETGSIYIPNNHHPCSAQPYKCQYGGQCFEKLHEPTKWRCVCLPGFLKDSCKGNVHSQHRHQR